jgi:hypothetical protein
MVNYFTPLLYVAQITNLGLGYSSIGLLALGNELALYVSPV